MAHFKLTYHPPPSGISPEEWIKPIGFVDTDFAACKDTHRSTSGYIFTVSGSPISWNSKSQATVALSMTKAEYIALLRASQQVRWMYLWYKEIRFKQPEPAVIT